MKKIPFIKPVFPRTEELREDFNTIVKNNFYTNSGPFEKKFESEIGKFISEEANVAVINNATTALILAIRSAIEKESTKKEIIIQSFTFAAGAEAILWCGFEPVFVDIQPDTWQANIEQTIKYLDKNNDKVAGILLCNTFGVGNQDISQWEKLAETYNLPLIIDSAAGLGSSYQDGELLGTRGTCEIFSMHATKPFAVGEGGLVVSRSEDFISSINCLKNFGFNPDREVDELGLNGKAPEITSAIALRQLKNYTKRLNQRRNLLALYKEYFAGTEVKFQTNDELSTVSFVSIKVEEDRIIKIMNNFKQANIDIRNYYNPPLHSHKLFKHFKCLDMYTTNDLCNTIISLPLHDDFNIKDINMICKKVLE